MYISRHIQLMHGQCFFVFWGLFGTLVSSGLGIVGGCIASSQVFRRFFVRWGTVGLSQDPRSVAWSASAQPSVPISKKHEMRSLLVSKISVLKRWIRFNENLNQKGPHSWVWRQSRDRFVDTKKTAKMQCSTQPIISTQIIQDRATTSQSP